MAKKPEVSKLDALRSQKQKLFVIWFTTPGDTFFNGTQSCKKAGYKGNDNTLSSQANENLRKPEIMAAVREQTRKLYSAADITADRVLSDIEMVRIMAVKEGKYHTALRASELHGKYLKLFADRVEHVHSIEDVTTQDLIEMAQQLAEKVDGLSIHSDNRGDGAGTSAATRAPGNKTTH
jgi:hypothetical protein